MERNVIVNDTYNTIVLETEHLDTDEVMEIERTLEEQLASGIQCIIINLRNVENITPAAGHYFEKFHNQFYNQGCSLVFAEPSENVHKRLKQEQLHLIINLSPTMEEAIDIISMEILERDLMNED
ncbi:MAG: STAS domain-containing protein [Taibaiella sp.]|nr:STAS domain-containing protein [Taibaiella sp.]MBX9449188.1 STAS domain-containing protein [Taibaiella sp.]